MTNKESQMLHLVQHKLLDIAIFVPCINEYEVISIKMLRITHLHTSGQSVRAQQNRIQFPWTQTNQLYTSSNKVIVYIMKVRVAESHVA